MANSKRRDECRRPCRGRAFDDGAGTQTQLVCHNAGGKPLIKDEEFFAGVEKPQGSFGVVTPAGEMRTCLP